MVLFAKLSIDLLRLNIVTQRQIHEICKNDNKINFYPVMNLGPKSFVNMIVMEDGSYVFL